MGEAFDKARRSFKLSWVSVTIHNCELARAPPSILVDLIVFPANWYGRLDGAFDHVISEVFSLGNEYLALTLVT